MIFLFSISFNFVINIGVSSYILQLFCLANFSIYVQKFTNAGNSKNIDVPLLLGNPSVSLLCGSKTHKLFLILIIDIQESFNINTK